MSVSFGLGVNLSTSQKLTPQMQQAIKLLQMSSLELAQEVQMKLDSNPLLERLDESDDFEEINSLDEWNNNSHISNESGSEDGFDDGADDADSFDKLDAMHLDDDAVDADWQDVYSDLPEGGHGDPSDGEHDYLGATSLSIQDYVRWQMNFKPLSALDKLIADHLIDAMDDSGFIRLSAEELVQNFATVLSFYQFEDMIDVAQVQSVLSSIQSCSPTGVGARNLSECLMLQLAQLPDDTDFLTEARMVLLCAEHVQNNNLKALMSETGLDVNDVRQAMMLIRTLDPSPAASFIDRHNAAASKPDREIPDVLVIAKDASKATTRNSDATTSWRVLLNPETLPQLRINQEYASLIKRGDDSYENQYLRSNLNDAKLFIRSIEERNQNLLKVATCIVQKQQAFLLSGAMAMQPLTLKDVAQEVDLHESTVSRLTSNKSMLTPQGLYPLKYFFSSHVLGSEGEVSSTAISAMIEEMIANEDPRKPLSDSELTRRLEAQGVDIARRTVAKYREAMNIPSSSGRKKRL